MGVMLCPIATLQNNIAAMVVHPQVSQLLHDAGPMLGPIRVVKLYSSHGTQQATAERPTANRLK
jgi:hypothetical protein